MCVISAALSGSNPGPGDAVGVLQLLLSNSCGHRAAWEFHSVSGLKCKPTQASSPECPSLLLHLLAQTASYFGFKSRVNK